jgi:hypothetical protein
MDESLEASWKELRPFKADKCLLDLPVLPEYRDTCEDVVKEAYLAEREAIQTVEELVAFVRKWRNVWLLKSPILEEEELRPELQDLLALDFDAEKVLYWLKRKAEEVPFPYETDVNVRIMAHIAIPIALLNASSLARHYGVGTDLGLVRLYLDPYPEHENKLR